MENSHEINVTNLDFEHRRALEDVIGAPLTSNQRLVISVTDAERPAGSKAAHPRQSVRDWTRVYEGLSDEEVEAIDRAVNSRANLTRQWP
jgi:hypothetical protein